jgi:hypothetical protein
MPLAVRLQPSHGRELSHIWTECALDRQDIISVANQSQPGIKVPGWGRNEDPSLCLVISQVPISLETLFYCMSYHGRRLLEMKQLIKIQL